MKHPDVIGVYPVKLSEDSPQKLKMMEESYYHIVKAKLERKRLWRALIYWEQVNDFVLEQHLSGRTEKQCVRSIRKALEESDFLMSLLADEHGLAKDRVSSVFDIILYGVLQDHTEAAILERVKCSPRSKAL